MMLSNGDKAVCKEIAREIIREVLIVHIQTCPHGRNMLKSVCIAVGIAIGSGIASGGTVIAIIRAFGG